MYPHHVEGKAIDLRHDNRMPELLAARDALAERIRESEADKDVIENEIKSKIGDAETAIVPGWRVSLREQHRKEHTVRASSFRVLRTAKEQEKAA
jgi:predicted phage-related endonuclease